MHSSFHVKTPLVQNFELSNKYSDAEHKTNIYFKLENFQPQQSFKIRGIGHMINEVAFILQGHDMKNLLN